MKKDWALLSGWAAGVFTAATVLICLFFVESRGRPVGTEALPFVVMGVILGPGPGLLILSAWISARLKRRHAGGAGRGSTLALGALVGAAAGFPAALLMPLIFFGRHVLSLLSDPGSPEALLMSPWAWSAARPAASPAPGGCRSRHETRARTSNLWSGNERVH